MEMKNIIISYFRSDFIKKCFINYPPFISKRKRDEIEGKK